MSPRFLLALAVAVTALSGCWSIDPNRPPLKDYEPPVIDGVPDTKPPSRI